MPQDIVEQINEILSEAPINAFELHGDWSSGAKPRGYDKPSIGIVTSQAGVEKIRQKWAKSHVDFDMYLVRSPKAYKHREVGEVKPEWVKPNLGVDIPFNEDAVTIIFTNNVGADKIPMTAWTLAHRFAHSARRGSTALSQEFDRFAGILERSLSLIARVQYGYVPDSPYSYNRDSNSPRKDIVWRQLCMALGTMKSCRDKNLRNEFEFTYELIAQHIVTGGIKLNSTLPRVIPLKFAWGSVSKGLYRRNLTPDLEAKITDAIDAIETGAMVLAYNVVDLAVSRVFVM